jgi:TATA-box binding protein (TBP) (component of TFIID and TFIIIB)
VLGLEELKRILSVYPKRTIDLTRLEELTKSFVHTYEEFADVILQLEKDQILEMVKSKGRTARTPSLAYQYRIQKSVLASSHRQELQIYRNKLHPAILLDEYFRIDPVVWKQDLPFIEKIDHYLKAFGFPNEPVPAPERSFELVQDEKWIVEKGGKEVLERIGLYERLQIIPVSEPLMFAVNPGQIHKENQFHLIVENKTTYQGLLPALVDTEFSTLIYGSGKVIIKSIEQFPAQYPVEANHEFFYFGDLDREGVSIWYSLTKRQSVKLALPFYIACLAQEPVKGKGYQLENREALQAFLTNFSKLHQDKIQKLLRLGTYYPQEILKSKQLQAIWRESDWKALI